MLGKRPEGPKATLFDVCDVVDHVVSTLGTIDACSRSIDPDGGRSHKVSDTITDNVANAGVATDGRPIRMCDVDLCWVSVILSRNAVTEETGVAVGALNHPANDAVRLTDRLVPHSVVLESGQVILGDSFARPVPVRAGDTFHYDYGPPGGIACHFV